MAEHVIFIIGFIVLTLTMAGLIMRGYEAKGERKEEETDVF
jgi:glucose uptake protein GlcU